MAEEHVSVRVEDRTMTIMSSNGPVRQEAVVMFKCLFDYGFLSASSEVPPLQFKSAAHAEMRKSEVGACAGPVRQEHV